jgi:carboxypeptidase C (cathepsin A)
MTAETTPEKNEKTTEEKKVDTTDNLVVTHHTTTLNNQVIHYMVTCGTIVFKEESVKGGEKEGESEGEKPKAKIFFVAYTREDVEDRSRRPLTFSFNGGPGSSSVWLHLGLLGPKRVYLDEEGNMTQPPFRLVENAFSLLDQTDLVFIDPVSTGFSRPVVGESARQFHGFKKDIETVGDFIRLYTTRYQRWTSPKFLIGESYGTTRAAALSGYLQERHGMYLNGIMLVSVVLDFSTLLFDPGNDLPYLLFLPTYTATAWYHHKLPADLMPQLREAMKQAADFVDNEYAYALSKGSALPAEQFDRVVQKLARLTGLSEEYVRQANLRIEIHRFTKELLRKEHKTVGRLDSRFKGIDRDAVGDTPEYDPSMSNIMGPYTAALNDYVRGELNFESDLPYEILNPKVWPWNYSDFENRYVNVAETLRSAMTVNPFLKVFIANGFYDLATPFYATEYTVHHLALDPSLQRNIVMKYYEAGHMMYIHLPSLAQMREDLVQFLQDAQPNSPGV